MSKFTTGKATRNEVKNNWLDADPPLALLQVVAFALKRLAAMAPGSAATLAVLALLLGAAKACPAPRGARYHYPGNEEAVAVIASPLPHTLLGLEALPAAWDWRDAGGINYAGPVLNQHIPRYCGACWAFAAVSALSDRFAIANGARWPSPFVLSPQVLLNCDGQCGTCDGGSSLCVYKYAYEHGLPDESCQSYIAADLSCTDEHICMTCSASGGCSAVSNYTQYRVAEYGPVSGVHEMLAEIFMRGPISCRIECSQAFLDYTGGVFKDKNPNYVGGHYVSLYGWGRDSRNDTPYWIGRNSWGTSWGEHGWFRIVVSDQIGNLGIETDCSFGVPA
eukprot:TRINITY_DN4324_c0_g1_i14.p1 TRINITY_DN4324_c0_g1~~TRINITY_DN4324_c0_g1_i14.p1  ORF type:complete len:335 (+),score=57.52 TRINITY_DN4324_c0_g1_i14:165-1169(+)